jgi:hypothetical protein
VDVRERMVLTKLAKHPRGLLPAVLREIMDAELLAAIVGRGWATSAGRIIRITDAGLKIIRPWRERRPEQDAIDAGLLVVTPRGMRVRSEYLSRYEQGCEGGCETGLVRAASNGRPKRRYCFDCERRMRADLAAAGWDQRRIDAWCEGADWPAIVGPVVGVVELASA